MNGFTRTVLLVMVSARFVEADNPPAPILRPKSKTQSEPRSFATNASSVSIPDFTLPPLAEGVVDLKFSEFFQSPVGPRGLEFTPRLQSLAGRKVRLLGYMIRQSDALPHGFLLSPFPVKLHEHEYGFADELPPSTVHVFTDPGEPAKVPYTPGLLLLTGTLSIGSRPELSGRASLVRLQLDPPTDAQRAASLQAQPSALENTARSSPRGNHSR